MQSEVSETVERPSVCLSHHLPATRCCGRFAAVSPVTRISSIAARLALGNKCEQYHVAGWHRKLNTDLSNCTLHIHDFRVVSTYFSTVCLEFSWLHYTLGQPTHRSGQWWLLGLKVLSHTLACDGKGLVSVSKTSFLVLAVSTPCRHCIYTKDVVLVVPIICWYRLNYKCVFSVQFTFLYWDSAPVPFRN